MTSNRGYSDFIDDRTVITNALDMIAETIETNKLGEESVKQLRRTKESLQHDAFRMMVVGEFKRGKSTLINALLGEPVLPARVAPCTAIITEVNYSDTPYAMLHYKDKEKDPLRISVDEIKDYVIIQDDENDAQSSQPSPYSKVSVYYPLELCKNNVQIVDSPGLNEHKTRTEVAMDFLTQADALIFVLSCQQALSQSELEFLENELGGRDLKNVFFVWNHYDAIIDSPEDIKDLQARSRNHLESKVGTSDRIFYASAREALLGKRKRDDELIERSKLPLLESELESFFVNDRGRVKLSRPLHFAKDTIQRTLAETVPRQRAVLDASVEQLQKVVEQQKPHLEDAEEHYKSILLMLERQMSKYERDVERSFEDHIRRCEIEVEHLLQEVTIPAQDAHQNAVAVRETLLNELQHWLNVQSTEWEKNELAAITQSHAIEIKAELQNRFERFQISVEKMQDVFETQTVTTELSPTSGHANNSGDFSLARREDYQPVALQNAQQRADDLPDLGLPFDLETAGLGVGAAVATSVAVLSGGLLAPVAMIVAGGLAGLFASRAAKRSSDLKREIKDEFVHIIRSNKEAMRIQILEASTRPLIALQENVDSFMKTRIDEVALQVQKAMIERKKGEDIREKERQRLDEAAERLMRAFDVLERIQESLQPVA